MRIIGGRYKGLRVQVPKVGDIRPTTDRAREALLNILSHRFEIEGSRVLDLFGGSGIVSMEFVSRGATSAICIEKNNRVAKAIQNEVNRLKIDGVAVLPHDALAYIKKIEEPFDFIFADPPYALPIVSDLPNTILEANILKPKGIFILEHEANVLTPDKFLLERRYYGQSVFSIYSSSRSENL